MEQALSSQIQSASDEMRSFAARMTIPRWSLPTSLFRPNPNIGIVRRFQQPRRAQSQIGYGRRRPQYNRFSRAQQIYGLWKTSPTFRLGIGAVGVGAGTFFVYNLEEVPVGSCLGINEEVMSLMRLLLGIRPSTLQLHLAGFRTSHC